MTAINLKQLDYTKEGVRYTIYVETAEGSGMWGTWNCHDCEIGGSSTKRCETLDEAVDAAKNDLARHHTANHSA